MKKIIFNLLLIFNLIGLNSFAEEISNVKNETNINNSSNDTQTTDTLKKVEEIQDNNTNKEVKEKIDSDNKEVVQNKVQNEQKQQEEEYIKSRVECYVQYKDDLNKIMLLTNNKKVNKGLFFDEVLNKEDKFSLINIVKPFHIFNDKCSDVQLSFKNINLEGEIVKTTLVLDNVNIDLPINKLTYNLQEIKEVVDENKQIGEDFKIKERRVYDFNLSFDKMIVKYSFFIENDIKISQKEIQKRFDDLKLYEKYLVVFNNELAYLGINENFENKVTFEGFYNKILGVFKLASQNEVLVIEERVVDKLRLSFSLNEFYTPVKLYKANKMTQEELEILEKLILQKKAKGFETSVTKFSFNDNLEDKNFSKYNSKLFLNKVIEMQKNNLEENNFKNDLKNIKMYLFNTVIK